MSRDIATPSRHKQSRSTPIGTKWSKIQDKLHQYSSSLNNHSSHSSVPSSKELSPQNVILNTTPPRSQHAKKPSFPINHYNLHRVSLSNNSPIQLPIPSFDDSFGSKTTSLPKTNTPTPITRNPLLTPTEPIHSFPQNQPQTPPIVQPYDSKISFNKPHKDLKNTNCCFCDELLSTKLGSEKIIELKCGDYCHEECLWVLLNHDDRTNEDLYSIFPKCEKCSKNAIPAEDITLDSIISRFLLATPPKFLANSNSSESLIISSNYEMPQIPPYYKQVRSPLSSSPSSISPSGQYPSKFQSLSLSSKNSKDLSINIPDRPHNRFTHYYTHPSRIKSKSRGSSISAISSIVSSVPKTPSPTISTFNGSLINSITSSAQKKISLAISRSKYVENLAKNLQTNFNPTITESDIDSFGLLRLVDELLVSQTGDNFKKFLVYLFQYKLTVIKLDYSDMFTYDLTSQPIINTPNSSILKASFVDHTRPLYLSHKTNSILQKWIAGLCDSEFIFDSSNISSTKNILNQDIDEDDLEQENDENKLTLPILLSPSPNIRRSSKNLDSITPVIELPQTYFEKTDSVIIIIDHERTLMDESITTLKNISKVLFHQFKNFKLIYSTNSFSNIHSYGDLNEVLNKIGDISTLIKDNKSINEVIEEMIDDENDDKYSLLILTNSMVKQKSLEKLSILNQLIVQINSNNLIIDQKFKKSKNHLYVDHWDKIMEILIPKLNLSFNSQNDLDIGDKFSDFDSSDFDSDFDSDADFNSDMEGDIYEETDKKEEETEENCDKTYSNESLNSENFNPGSTTIDTSPLYNLESNKLITSEQNNDNNNDNNTNENNPARWSTLLKDIDKALLETTASLSQITTNHNDS